MLQNLNKAPRFKKGPEQTHRYNQFQTTLIILKITLLTSDVARSIKNIAIYHKACTFLDLDVQISLFNISTETVKNRKQG